MEDSREELEKIRARKQKEESIRKLVKDVADDSLVFEKVVNNLIEEYVGDMDCFSQQLDLTLRDIKKGKLKNYSQLRLEIRTLELANAMYKATDGLATLGSQTDVAKTNKEEAFAKAYAKIKEGTIPDKKALAQDMIIQEAMIEKIIQRAYQVIAQKVKSANRTLEAIKKVLTSHMVNKEVFRKEAPGMDRIENTDIDEGDLPDTDGDDSI